MDYEITNKKTDEKSIEQACLWFTICGMKKNEQEVKDCYGRLGL